MSNDPVFTSALRAVVRSFSAQHSVSPHSATARRTASSAKPQSKVCGAHNRHGQSGSWFSWDRGGCLAAVELLPLLPRCLLGGGERDIAFVVHFLHASTLVPPTAVCLGFSRFPS